MNKQQGPNRIEWTEIFGPGTGFTWNPVGGCAHNCRWTMPDGKIAVCYAETTAEGVARETYPQGFAHHYWNPHRLNEPVKRKQPAGIFLDSMSDLMGTWVPDEQVEMVLEVCEKTPQHIYFLLTKNAPRLRNFQFPKNVFIGASMPPDFMFGKELTSNQKVRMLERILDVLTNIQGRVTWLSAEPLSWDIAPLLAMYPDALDWMVVGAASNGKEKYPPREEHLKSLLAAAGNIPIFYKGNLRSLPYAATNWQEEFPITK